MSARWCWLLLVGCRGPAPADSGGAGDGDSAPGDTAHGDSAPGDTAHGDSAPGDTAHGDTAGGADTWVWDPADASYDAADVQAHLTTVLDFGLPDPGSLLDWFTHIVEIGGGEGCPNMMNGNMNAGIGGCLASTQYTFAGIFTYAPVEGSTDDFEIDGDGYVDDPQHNLFQLNGKIVQAVATDGWSLAFSGTWGYPLADGWVRGVPSSALLLEGSADGTRVSGGYGIGDDEVYFHELGVDAAGVATGEVRLRDPAGAWYVLTLESSVDGCGEVVYDGAALGSGCVDVATLLADVSARVLGAG